MTVDAVQYGLRSRSTGNIVRVEDRHYQHEEEGDSVDRWLSYDESFPHLREDSLGSIMFARYSEDVWGRKQYSYLNAYGIPEISDLEVVVFETSSEPTAAGKGDPARYLVEVSRLEFNLVTGVRYQFNDRRPVATALAAIFNPDEIARLKQVPNIKVAVLKSDTVDVATAGLAGSILVPRFDEHGLPHHPVGVVDVRTVGGVTYGVISDAVTSPAFYKVVSLVDDLEHGADPWDDCKVAFGFDDAADEDAENLLDEIWEEEIRAQGSEIWPAGWSINETDRSGGRMVVVFRVDGQPSRADGRLVRNILNKIEHGIDPRGEAPGQKMGR